MKNQELYQIMADHMEKNKNMLATVIEGENTGKTSHFLLRAGLWPKAEKTGFHQS